MADVYAVLVPELRDDPLGRGYAGMTDAQRLASLTAADRPGDERAVVDAYEIIEATVPAEWAALSAAEKQRYQTLVSAGRVNLRGANTRLMLAAMFAAGTTTRGNLIALQSAAPRTRAAELGLTTLGLGHMASARDLIGG